MALNDDISLLSTVPLFSGMTADQLRLIAFGAERRYLSAGTTLFRERAPAECAYVVATGTLELSAVGRQGKLVIEGTAGPGTMLSELALITLVERKYTAVATEDSEVVRITRMLFQRLVEEYPSVAGMIEARIVANIRALGKDLEPLARYFG